MTHTIHHGDCLEVLRQMPDNSVDAVVCDPPYGLSNTSPDKVADAIVRWATGDREYIPEGRGFMGSRWDAFVPPPAVWDEIYRVLKPGGHLVAFAGSRTHDLMGISIRLSGMDVRDSISWIAGSGFPKSHNIGKSTGDPKWDGWGTALKPSVEPISLARKPLSEKTVAANTLTWGTGGLNIDATRIGTTDTLVRPEITRDDNAVFGKGLGAGTQSEPAGRWPANVVLDPDTAKALDQQSGNIKGQVGMSKTQGGHRFITGDTETVQKFSYGVSDDGGASRFFKVCEPDEHGAVSPHFPREFDERVVEPDPPFMYAAKAPKKERPRYEDEQGNVIQHPTTKPLSIMKWLVRLTCPPGGTILDPFAGSGTTIEAAMLEGFNVIGIEREAEYLPLIQQRIDRATDVLPMAS